MNITLYNKISLMDYSKNFKIRNHKMYAYCGNNPVMYVVVN